MLLSLCKLLIAVLTFCRIPVICSYLPVAFGKFSKLITGEMFCEKLSGFGSLEYGDAPFRIGVPKLLVLTIALVSFVSTSHDFVLSEVVFVSNSAKSCCFLLSRSINDGDARVLSCNSSFEEKRLKT